MAMRSDTRLVLSSHFRGHKQARFEERDRTVLRLLAPHYCRSLTIADALSLKSLKSQTLEATLESVAAGVYLLARDGGVVHMNQAAAGQVAAGGALSISGNRLVPVDGAAAAHLALALGDAARRETRLPPSGRAIAIPGNSGGGFIATVLPLDGGRRSAVARPLAAIAVVFVQDPRAITPLPGEAFATLYRLTSAEIRVTLAMATGLQPQEVADTLGNSLPTVKSHLARIFEKTGTTRQADLVALLTRAAPPLARPTT
jgi:DNA-binding CsgD family transcriptional regulator